MRKIIQICESAVPATSVHNAETRLTALCDDGSVWFLTDGKGNWKRYPDIPQDDFEQTNTD